MKIRKRGRMEVKKNITKLFRKKYEKVLQISPLSTKIANASPLSTMDRSLMATMAHQSQLSPLAIDNGYHYHYFNVVNGTFQWRYAF